MGTETWALRVDGDELYDPARARMRSGSRSTRRARRRVPDPGERPPLRRARDPEERVASGWLSPPCRPVTELFNLGGASSRGQAARRAARGRTRSSFRTGSTGIRIDPLHERYELGRRARSATCTSASCGARASTGDTAEPRLTPRASPGARRGVVGIADEGGAPSAVSPQIEVVALARLELEAREVRGGAARRPSTPRPFLGG